MDVPLLAGRLTIFRLRRICFDGDRDVDGEGFLRYQKAHEGS